MAVLLSESSKGNETDASNDVENSMGGNIKRTNKCTLTSFIIGICAIVFSVVELVFQLLQFEGLLGTEYFWKDLQKTLLTLDTNIPVLLVAILGASALIAILAVIYLMTGNVGTFGFHLFFLTLRLFLCMTIMAFFFQIYCYHSYYPSASRQAKVHKEMQDNLPGVHPIRVELPDTKEDAHWAATQLRFQCCGINSYNDWLSAPHITRNMLVKPSVLPLTCCQVASKCRFRKILVTGEIVQNSTSEQGVLFTIEDEQASPPLCLPAKAYQKGCLPQVLDKIDSAGIHVLIDYGVLILCHFILMWALKSTVVQPKYQGHVIPRTINAI